MYGMDLYRRVRLACHGEGLSQREVARRFGVDRQTVAKMLLFSVPPGYWRRGPPPRPKLDAFVGIIQGDPRRGQDCASQAAAHGETDLRAAAADRWAATKTGPSLRLGTVGCVITTGGVCPKDEGSGQIGGSDVVWDDWNTGSTAKPAYGFWGTQPYAGGHAVPEFICEMSGNVQTISHRRVTMTPSHSERRSRGSAYSRRAFQRSLAAAGLAVAVVPMHRRPA